MGFSNRIKIASAQRELANGENVSLYVIGGLEERVPPFAPGLHNSTLSAH